MQLRLLLLYRLAVVKRSRVKLAAFFCARLAVSQETAKDGLSSGNCRPGGSAPLGLYPAPESGFRLTKHQIAFKEEKSKKK